ncbi:MAG: hypothetical protein U1F20_09100 [Lysobacterales bacterium]
MVTKASAAASSLPGAIRRAMRHTSQAHNRNANADGRRAAHGLRPERGGAGGDRPVGECGGLVQWPTSSLRCGLSQSPLSSMFIATLV